MENELIESLFEGSFDSEVRKHKCDGESMINSLITELSNHRGTIIFSAGFLGSNIQYLLSDIDMSASEIFIL